jgi:hypothetical protein
LPLIGACYGAVDAAWPGLEAGRRRHEALRRVFGAMVEDAIAESRARLAAAAPASADQLRRLGHPVVAFSEPMRAQVAAIRRFLFARMYRAPRVMEMRAEVTVVVRDLFATFLGDPALLPAEWQPEAGALPGRPPAPWPIHRRDDRPLCATDPSAAVPGRGAGRAADAAVMPSRNECDSLRQVRPPQVPCSPTYHPPQRGLAGRTRSAGGAQGVPSRAAAALAASKRAAAAIEWRSIIFPFPGRLCMATSGVGNPTELAATIAGRATRDPVAVEPPRDAAHGDMATNAAMVLAKPAGGQKPRDIAEVLAGHLAADPRIASAEVAGPGFLNLRLAPQTWRDLSVPRWTRGDEFGRSTLGAGRKVNVEFVSANPTGPMHVGHTRGAVFGDALARLMDFTGHT